MSALSQKLDKFYERKIMFRFISSVQEIGACQNRTALTVTDTAVEITLTTGYNSIEIVPGPNETAEIYFGGSGVTAANGVPLGSGKIFNNCKSGFSIYLITATTANVRIAEYV